MNRVSSFARSHVADVLIVLAATVSAFQVAVGDDPIRAPRSATWFAVTAILLVTLPLLARRRWPFGAPAAVWVLGAACSCVDGRLLVYSAGPPLAGMAASFLLSQVPDPVRARIGLGVVAICAAVIALNDPNGSPGSALFSPATFAIPWLAGYALRERAARAEAAARVAAAEERVRIARELHDIVAHAMSVMVLQVGAVRHSLPEGEDRAALDAVERTGRTALTDMRRLLGALRHGDDDVELAPQPGLEQLDPLLDDVRRAGLPVALRVDGEPVELPRTLELSAYRVVQEGLTNALKHANATHADVLLRYGPDRLRIDVRDDGRGGGGANGRGHGLVGIRERVKMYGGEMTAGGVDGGGFVLSTSFPIEGGRP